MKLNDIILNRRLIELEVFEHAPIYYTGVCIKANSSVWTIINYDLKKKRFDGYTIFKNEDVNTYSLYKKKYIKINNEELAFYEQSLKWNKINSFYDAISEGSKLGLLVIFLKDDSEGYYVGKLIELEKNQLSLRLVDSRKKYSQKKTILIETIKYISFFSTYEREILKKIKKDLKIG